MNARHLWWKLWTFPQTPIRKFHSKYQCFHSVARLGSNTTGRGTSSMASGIVETSVTGKLYNCNNAVVGLLMFADFCLVKQSKLRGSDLYYLCQRQQFCDRHRLCRFLFALLLVTIRTTDGRISTNYQKRSHVIQWTICWVLGPCQLIIWARFFSFWSDLVCMAAAYALGMLPALQVMEGKA